MSAQRKNEIVQKAFGGQLPRNFVRYLQALVNHRRQMLIPVIAHEYHDLVDRVEGRVHASVTVMREPEEADRALVTNQLSRTLGKEVVPHFHVNPSILGGIDRPRRRHRARRLGSSTAGEAAARRMTR